MRGSILATITALVLACGGDDGGSDDATTAPTTSVGTTSGSTNTDVGSTSGDVASSSGALDSSSGGAESTGADTTGGAGDPSYPPPGAGGSCPAGTAVVALPGATACAPFCGGEGDPCPAPATGDAVGVCAPFAMRGSSETPCANDDACMAPEVCGPEGTCIEIAFWGCQLACDGGQTCPDAMTCAVGLCGYP